MKRSLFSALALTIVLSSTIAPTTEAVEIDPQAQRVTKLESSAVKTTEMSEKASVKYVQNKGFRRGSFRRGGFRRGGFRRGGFRPNRFGHFH